MNFYKNINNNVFAIEEDGSQDHLILEDWQLITKNEMLNLTSHVMTASEAETIIDRCAGSARYRFISPGEGILQEYQRAYDQAAAFKAAGYTGEPPSAVEDNMRYKSLSAQAAADDIIAEGDQLNLVLDSIRTIRLDGKAAVQALQEGDDVAAVAQTYIDQLNEIKP